MPTFRPRVLILALLTLFTLPTSYGFYRWEGGNFDVVSPDRVYRSRQLNGEELVQTVKRHGIRSILNLRGRNLGAVWYRDEVAVAKRFDVRLIDYPISAHLELRSKEIHDLLDILRSAPKPLLIHCKSGADRTSLVSAMYLHVVEGFPPETAAQQLSAYYGHLPPVLGTESSAMDRTFWGITRSSPMPHSPRVATSPSGTM